MSGEPTDVQLLTCKAREVDVSTFLRASANRINANYGNYIFFIHFSKTSDLVAYYYFMYNGGCLQGQSSGCLPSHEKKVRIYLSSEFTGTSDWSLAMSFVVACIGICIVTCIGLCIVACIGICIVACIGICMVACRSTGLTTHTLWEARGVSSYLQHGRRI